MSRFTGRMLVAVFALAVPVASAGEQPAANEERKPAPERRRHIRVLQDPKDISSFYRSSGRRNAGEGPYALASYYRSSEGGRGYGYGYGYGYGGWRPADEEPCLMVAPPPYTDRRR